MRIAVVAAHAAPDPEGGSELVARAQARALAARGHEVALVAGARAADGSTARARRDGVDVLRLARAPDETPYGLAFERPALLERAAQACAGADAIHVHHAWTLSTRLVRRLAEIAPVVLVLHDHFASCVRFFRRSPVAGLACPPPGEVGPCARCLAAEAPGVAPDELERGLRARAAELDAELDAAARLAAPSRRHADAVARWSGLDPRRLVVVAPGLCREPLAARPAPPPEPADVLRVAHFGHLGAEKGTLALARSLASLAPGRFELVLAGGFVRSDDESGLAAAAGDLPVRSTGPYATLEELASALAGCHLAAFPSRLEESYGLVLDEAWALGLPTWVSDRGAPAERVGAAGRVLPAEDEGAWARALARLADGGDGGALARERAAIPAVRTAADAAAELEALTLEVLGGAPR